MPTTAVKKGFKAMGQSTYLFESVFFKDFKTVNVQNADAVSLN